MTIYQAAEERAHRIIAASQDCPARQSVAAALAIGGRPAAQEAAMRLPHSAFRSALLRALRVSAWPGVDPHAEHVALAARDCGYGMTHTDRRRAMPAKVY